MIVIDALKPTVTTATATTLESPHTRLPKKCTIQTGQTSAINNYVKKYEN